MALRPITEQQFRTRRKDRRMVWVDATAFLVGLMMLVGGVGGVMYVEEEIQPFDWGYSFFEGKAAAKHCAGYNDIREGCTTHVQTKIALEGVPIKTSFDPVTMPNVTKVRFTLKWIDEVPITSGTPQECKKECGKHYEYTNESTDTLMLTVTPPAGIEVPAPQMLPNDQNTKIGQVTIEFPFLELPKAGTTTAFTMDEAREKVYQQHVAPDHRALGTWSAEVVVVKAGDQNGTIPGSACPAEAAPVVDMLPPDVSGECDLDDDHGTIEDAAVYPPEQYYTSHYDDIGNKWQLEFVVSSYDVQLSVG